MTDAERKRDSSNRVQIIVALIGLVGVIAAALIANWSNIFGTKPGPPPIPIISKKSERPVHSSGRLTVRSNYMCDLDTGTETSSAGADFQWEQATKARRFLKPMNGAGFVVVGSKDFESVRWSDMVESFPYSKNKIDGSDSSNRLPAGTVIAYKTNEGRLGKFIVDESGYNLTIRWRTYD